MILPSVIVSNGSKAGVEFCFSTVGVLSVGSSLVKPPKRSTPESVPGALVAAVEVVGAAVEQKSKRSPKNKQIIKKWIFS